MSLERARTLLVDVNENLETAVAARTAELRESNDEIQRFAYLVSHDLRAPLVNIMGFTSELEALRGDMRSRLLPTLRPDGTAEPPSGPPLNELLQDFDESVDFIKASISKMDRLINAILVLSREGRRRFSPEPIDVGMLLKAIAGGLTQQAQAADASIEIGDMPTIVSDRLALDQIFSNLLDNAIKYLRNGVPGAVEVRARESGGYVVFAISDNGRGVEDKDRARVFELFRRSGVQDRPGEGIGLAHVRALVKRLGGEIEMDSVFGQGTTFSVRLPKVWKGTDE